MKLSQSSLCLSNGRPTSRNIRSMPDLSLSCDFHATFRQPVLVRAHNSASSTLVIKHRFGLIPIGGRSTAVKLASGKIVLFASHPNDDATAKTLQEMGETVSHIIALDAVHHMYLTVSSAQPLGTMLIGKSKLCA